MSQAGVEKAYLISSSSISKRLKRVANIRYSSHHARLYKVSDPSHDSCSGVEVTFDPYRL
jgi:hypothetical protein